MSGIGGITAGTAAIVTGIAVLLKGALKMNKAMDREMAQKRRSGSEKGDS